MKVKITRLYQTPINSIKKQTEGLLVIRDDNGLFRFECKTLELAWHNNKNSISCIPAGSYPVKKRKAEQSGSFGYDHLHFQNVAGRKWILIHAGNFFTQIRGCILVGNKFTDINNDRIRDVLNSRQTLDKIMAILPDKFEAEICWRN